MMLFYRDVSFRAYLCYFASNPVNPATSANTATSTNTMPLANLCRPADNISLVPGQGHAVPQNLLPAHAALCDADKPDHAARRAIPGHCEAHCTAHDVLRLCLVEVIPGRRFYYLAAGTLRSTLMDPLKILTGMQSPGSPTGKCCQNRLSSIFPAPACPLLARRRSDRPCPCPSPPQSVPPPVACCCSSPRQKAVGSSGPQPVCGIQAGSTAHQLDKIGHCPHWRHTV